MHTQTFLRNFTTIAEASGGVQQLRELVLDLAVSGRLVDQDPSDEPCDELLRRIASAQARLVADGIAKSNRAHSPRPPEGRTLPTGWCWTYMPRLGFVNPRNSVDPDVVAGFVPMPLIPTDTRETVGFEERAWSVISQGYTHIADGDVAVAKITPCFQNGKSAVFTGLPSGVGAATTELFVLRPTPGGVSARYIHLVLRSPGFIQNGVPEMTGTAGQQRLPRQYFTDAPIPLPPLAEQERIVAKVDELMGLCDELESRQEGRRRVTTRFRGSALQALTEAEAPDDLRRAWERVSTNWPTLTDHPDSIEELRQASLRLAVDGRFTANAVESGRLAVLGEIASMQNGYAFKSEWYTNEGISLLRCQNIGHGELRWRERRAIAAERAVEFARFELRLGDIVLALDRPLISTGLKVARVQERDLPCLLLQRVARVAPDAAELDADYLWLWLHSPAFVESIDPGRSKGVPHISTREVASIEMWLPSLPAQRDTVRWAERLLPACARLRQALDEGTAAAAALADAVADRLMSASPS